MVIRNEIKTQTFFLQTNVIFFSLLCLKFINQGLYTNKNEGIKLTLIEVVNIIEERKNDTNSVLN